jgi:protein-tyrosine phosphatase
MNAKMKLLSVPNFRAIGGYPTRDGRIVRSDRLYRSSHLGRLSPSDRKRLDAAGIRTVFDLRNKRDIRTEGEMFLPAGARLLHLNAFGDSAASDLRPVLMSSDRRKQEAVLGGGRAEGLMSIALVQLALGRTPVFSTLLTYLSEKSCLPAIVHCSAGKDRTGWAATIVLLALGVEEKYVLEHYLLSNEYRRAEVESSLTELSRYIDGDLVRPLLEVRPQYLLSAFRAITKRFDSFDSYLTKMLKFDHDRRQRLQANFLQ